MQMFEPAAYAAAMVLGLGGLGVLGITGMAVIGWIQYRIDGGRMSLLSYLRGL